MKCHHNSTHRSLDLLFRSLLLQSFLLKGLFCGGGGRRQVLWAEAKALKKLEDLTVLFLKL